ncbi:MAG: 2-dehydro-3-deoxyphosphogluconate aldolase, partial [Bacteroidetes bacterium]|nr:2-dehydro-3-deoxyphosphogluconate aldolase [Bacteroidota bacterium]
MNQSTVSSTDRQEVARRLEEVGAAAVIRMQDAGKLVRVAEAIAAGGIPAIEVTMTVPGAIDMIKQVADELGDDVLLGVGSVTDVETARQAVDAGARYVVSPIYKRVVVEATHDKGAVALPGAFTPTEIQHAYEAGAEFVKVFPASVLGAKF